MSEDTKTLGEHAKEFFAEQGLTIDLKTVEGKKAYEVWADWAFSNMDGKRKNRENQAWQRVKLFINNA